MVDSNIIHKINSSNRKLLLLDYDGTLVPLKNFPNESIPSRRLIELLQKAISNSQTELFVVTGRSRFEIDNFLGDLQIDLIAEHGAFIKKNGNWIESQQYKEFWKNDVRLLLDKITCQFTHSFVEEKSFSLAWHYRNVEEHISDQHLNELILSLQALSESSKFRIIKGNKVIEIVNSEINKGFAVKKIVESSSYDCIVCIGDDTTDEDMFSYLANNKKAISIKVGEGASFAKHRLNDVDSVLQFLEKIIK
jgi:trehalose 6-phosphate synthase/phosphatase